MIAPILLHVCLHYCYWPLTHTNALNFPKQKILKRRRLSSVAANMIALVCVRKRSNHKKKTERERERGRKNWNRKPEAEKMVVERRIGLLWKRMMKYSTTAERKRRRKKEKGQHHALHSILRFEKRSCVQSPLPTCLISWTSEVGWTSLKPNHKDSKIWRKIKNFNEKK